MEHVAANLRAEVDALFGGLDFVALGVTLVYLDLVEPRLEQMRGVLSTCG